MFTRLRYYVKFTPLNAREIEFDRELYFKAGLTAIIGPNEKGKSLTLEMMRFLLFGTAALRGVTADYGNLTVDGDLTLGDDLIKIERTISGAKIWENGELKARGTTPVNRRILERLGFGLKVFDVANSINQGAVEALSDMRPTERQKLVGGVVGLDKIDGLMTFANNEALLLDREATSMERALHPPVCPPEPEGYPNRGILRDFLGQAEKDQLELAKIEGQIAGAWPAMPINPGPRPIDLTEEELEAHIADNQRHQQLLNEQDRLPTIDVEKAVAELEAFEAHAAAQETLLKVKASDLMAPDVCQDIIAKWELYDEWCNYEWLRGERDRLQTKIDQLDHVNCPECDHHFPLDPALVEAARAELAGLPELPPVEPLVVGKPACSRATAEAHLERAVEYEAMKQAEADALATLDRLGEVVRPKYSRFDLENYNPTRAEEIRAELSSLTLLLDADKHLQALREWKIRSEHYENHLAEYERCQKILQGLIARREELAYAPARLAELRPIVMAFDPYERAMEDYTHADMRYRKALAEVGDARARAEKWRAGKEALGVLRTLIKQHLYPSLAKASSSLLAGMTNGARRRVEIDEDFDVLIDGQRLDTLSGSAKAVANLSIRLGLGQVLTHKVLPIIFADEIDASMDDNRAASTHDILRQCSRQVSQLLLVSHQTPDADHVIDLGEIS